MIKANPLVSILIPLYNAEKYVIETLDSCINQTYKNIEIVVVDDESKDNSLTIVQEYSKQHPQVKVYTQPNGGGCKARNLAFDKSSGDLIVYLDADDIISPDKIETQVKLLEGKPITTISTSQWDRFYTSLEDAKFPNRIVYRDYDSGVKLVEDLLNGGMFGVTCYMTSSVLIEQAGAWNENLLVNQDGEFFVRVLLKTSKIVYSDKGFLYYRSNNPNSTSRKKNTEQKGISLLYSYEQIRNYIEKSNMMSDKMRYGLVQGFQSVAYQYVQYKYITAEAKRSATQLLPHSISTTNGGRGFAFGCKIFGFWNVLKIKKYLGLIK